MLCRIAVALMLLLTAGCGVEEADLTEPTCWTENGNSSLFWHVPSGTEVSEELENTCREIHNVYNR